MIVASWPTPEDDWTKEHVLSQVEKSRANLVRNTTASLQSLAKRRPDVVVFADASFDRKTYFMAFGRVAPVQVCDVCMYVCMYVVLSQSSCRCSCSWGRVSLLADGFESKFQGEGEKKEKRSTEAGVLKAPLPPLWFYHSALSTT